MPAQTGIQWCDSSANLQMGCEGCELSSKIKGDKATCYAETLTNRWAGVNSGWPESFMKPKIFMERLPKLIRWRDLTGSVRADKPWLDGMPRIVFLNDMGDTFSSGMPEDWFAAALPEIKKSPHQYLVLTKWPHRFVEFSERNEIPKNVWPGTSVTGEKFKFRVRIIQKVHGGGPKWISAEPQYGKVDYASMDLSKIDWIIFGGESGPNAAEYDVQNMIDNIEVCKTSGIRVFVKQLGAKPVKGLYRPKLKDGHGGDWSEWPKELRIREMPALK